MGGRVGTGNGIPALPVYDAGDLLLDLQRAVIHYAVVEVLAGLVLLDVGNGEDIVLHRNGALVRRLAAHFCIEGSLIQNNDALFTLTDGRAGLAIGYQWQESCPDR